MGSDSFSLHKTGNGFPLTVCFPGWATDHRIFDSLDLPTNRLDLAERGFDELAAHIRADGPASVVLMGWSLGGFIAVEFARRFPELVSRLILCGVRARYPADQIESTRSGIIDSKERCLTSFYRQCFLPAQKEDYQRFRDELMPYYLNDMSADCLLTSLEYLGRVEMNAGCLPDRPICMIHGAQDIVAPVHEAMEIAEHADNVRLHVIQNAGHAAFLTAESMEIIRQCLK